MKLSDLIEKEKQRKVQELIRRIKGQINKVPLSELDDAIEYNKNLFYKEKHELFSQKSDPKEYYHWIEHFAGVISSFKGAPYSFEEKFELSKHKSLSDYKGHKYLPKVKKFLNQSDEDVALKLAHYFAYNEVADLFNSEPSAIKENLGLKISRGKRPLNVSEDTNTKTNTSSDTIKASNKQGIGKEKQSFAEIMKPDEQEIMFTSIKQIADIFKCSLPTAQKIKNSIPKELYRQCGKTFAIPKSILLSANDELINSKYRK